MSKISELSDGGSLQSTDYLIAVRSGGNVKVQLSELPSGIGAGGNIVFGDNEKAIFGAGSDLQIFHDGANSRIYNSTGSLLIRNDDAYIQSADGTASAARFNATTGVTLYRAGAAKLATTSTGIDVTGTVTADGLTVAAAGTTTVSIAPSSAGTAQLTMSGTGGGAAQITSSENGMYFTNTDTGAFIYTSNSTEKMRLDGSGNVGIGTTSPSNLLHVAGASAGALDLARFRLEGATNNPMLKIEADEANQTAGIDVSGSTTTELTFSQGGTERMRITSAGNVGIGTSSPSAPLHIANATPVIRLEDTSASVSHYINSNNAELRVQAASVLSLRTSVGEAMRIDASGNVGIGTSSPNGVLETNSTGDNFTYLRSGDSNTAGIIFGNQSDSATASIQMLHSDNSLSIRGYNNAERMRITSAGNVGIGTSSPSSQLEVSGSAGPLVKVTSTATGTPTAFVYSSINGADFGSLTNHPTRFYVNNSERMRLDASGNLLVGKTASAIGTAGFEAAANGNVLATRSAGVVMSFNRLSTDGAVLDIRKDGTTVGSIGTASSGDLYIADGRDAGLKLDGGNNQILPVTSAGAQLDNTLDLGKADTRFKDLYLSGGVYLGGTGAANKLEDYETGTFTPVITDSAGNTYTGSYAGRNGRYTKIGRICQVTFEMYVGADLTVNGLNGSLPVAVSNFPFANNSANFSAGIVSNGNGINYTSDQIMLKMARSATEVRIAGLSSSTGSNESEVTVTQFDNGNRLVYGTIVYEVA